MKAFLLKSFGLDGLSMEDVPDVQPGPGQVLVKMRAWSLNYRDLLVVRGIYAPKLKLPFQILSDGVGEIAAIGAGVTRVKPGDRVAGIFMQDWSGRRTIAGEIGERAGRSRSRRRGGVRCAR